MKRILRLALLLPGLSTFAADLVTLKDGRQISGIVEFGVSSQIRIRTGESSQMISIDQIQSIQVDPIEAPAPAVTSAAPAPAPATSPRPVTAVATPPTPVAPAAAAPTTASTNGITLPAGTEIAIRTVDLIDSKKASRNKEYAASLDDPVVVDGMTVIPVNADAILRVSEVESAGVTRQASLSLSLVVVTVNWQRIDVKTDPVDSKSGSQAKRSATGAGVGAAASAGVGAAAGGAVGAGIGAGIGAAAGTAVAVVKGKTVEIKPETRFTYKLTDPIVITPEASR